MPILIRLTACSLLLLSLFGNKAIADTQPNILVILTDDHCYGTTHIKMKDSDLSARVYRSLIDVARQYRESIDVYGSKESVEWPLIEGKPMILQTAKRPEPEIPEEIECPDFGHLLPDEIAPFTTGGVYDEDETQHLSFTQGAGHGGSHPHLVHEFLTALAEDRDPWPNAKQSANWTCTGICSHESALAGGAIKHLPVETLS